MSETSTNAGIDISKDLGVITDAKPSMPMPPIVKPDTSARASEDGRLPEIGRKHPSFRYPVLRNPTGRVQFCMTGAEVVTIDPIGDVRRGQVVSIGPANKPPNAKALDFARGLVASRMFAHCAADTPLGVPTPAPTPEDLDLKSGFVPPAK